jgi:DNA replication protein DnaC
MTMSLADQLRALGLRHAGAHLDDIIDQATRKRWSPAQLLEHIADQENQDRSRRSVERRLNRSRVGRFKPMSAFDWDWPKRIDRPAVEAALALDFVQQARNVVLVAPQGLGKSMIAKNIAHNAVMAGHSVLFISAAQLLLDLAAQDSARALERRLRHYSRPALLVCDEIGYLSYDNRNADLLFQVISRRYESKSVVLTTNLAFSAWPSVFPNATCAVALIDRVVHHADVIAIEGDSYRKREAEADVKTRKKRPAS